MLENEVDVILEKFDKLDLNEKRILSSSLKSLGFEDELKYNSFGHKFREMMSKVLHRLAPDEDVISCSWYVDENDNKPTRRQRLLYAIKSGLDDEFIECELEIDLAPISKRLGKIVAQLNKYTHFGDNTFDVSKEIGEAFVLESLDFLLDFFSIIDDIRNQIVNACEILLTKKITEATINDVMEEIDVLATHYSIDGNDIEAISVTNIDAHFLYIRVDGSVDVTHQFGSDGDLRRGDGVEFGESYPFTVNTKTSVLDPLDIEIATYDIKVNTDSYYEDGEEESEEYAFDDEPYEYDESDYEDEPDEEPDENDYY